jgi:hypothetical protein
MVFSAINPRAESYQVVPLKLFRGNLPGRFYLSIKNFCKDVSDFLRIFVVIGEHNQERFHW